MSHQASHNADRDEPDAEVETLWCSKCAFTPGTALELATEHYRFRNIAQKVRASFSIYARARDASNLRRALDQHELTAEILSL